MYTYIHIVYIHIVYIQQKHRRSTNADAIQRNYFQNVVFRFTQLYKSDQIHDFSSSPVQIECLSFIIHFHTRRTVHISSILKADSRRGRAAQADPDSGLCQSAQSFKARHTKHSPSPNQRSKAAQTPRCCSPTSGPGCSPPSPPPPPTSPPPPPCPPTPPPPPPSPPTSPPGR